MPVEIRELVIQARLKEETKDNPGPINAPQNTDNIEPDYDQIAEVVYERCIAKLKEWLADQSSR